MAGRSPTEGLLRKIAVFGGDVALVEFPISRRHKSSLTEFPRLDVRKILCQDNFIP